MGTWRDAPVMDAPVAGLGQSWRSAPLVASEQLEAGPVKPGDPKPDPNDPVWAYGASNTGQLLRYRRQSTAELVHDVTSALPAAGATVGMLATGGAALPVAAGAAALGAAGGEAWKQNARRAAGADAPTTPGGAAAGIALQGAVGGAQGALPGVVKAVGEIPAVGDAAEWLASRAAAHLIPGGPIAQAVASKFGPAVLARLRHFIGQAGAEASPETAAAMEAAMSRGRVPTSWAPAAPEASIPAGMSSSGAVPLEPSMIPAEPVPLRVPTAAPQSEAIQEAGKLADRVTQWKAAGFSRPQMVSALRQMYGSNYVTPSRAGQMIDMVLSASEVK